MNTGIAIDPEVEAAFNDMRMNRKHRYIIWKVNDSKDKIVNDVIGARDATFEEFKNNMPKDECR